MSELKQVSKEELKDVVEGSTVPVLIDFTTDGCGPCELVVPILKDLNGKYGEQIQIIQHNVDFDDLVNENNEHVKTYDVMGFPTLIITKDGKPMDNIIGVYDKDEIEKRIQNVL